ncbi:MAG: response regulator [Gorillibacterium sp.]|nr:response regulator [Gorillibacterium sp.]
MYKLVVIDDEKEARDNICNYFPWHELGFQIVAKLENGKQGIEFFEKDTADVLLCDIRMPLLSGLDLAEWMNERNLKAKVVLISGHRDFEYAQRALQFGVKNYIVKPVTYNELTSVFTKLSLDLQEESKATSLAEPEARKNKVMLGCNINDKIVAVVYTYVQEQFKDATLDAAAELVHLHPNYLSQLFYKTMGQYFSDYVIQVKMEKAAELLNEIQYKTYEVSEMVGYSNAKNFTRTFKKYFGKNPRQFRQSEHEPYAD